MPLHQRGQDRRVEPAAQVGRDRHVGAQLQAHGVVQRLAHLLFPILERALFVLVLRREVVLPVAALGAAALLEHQDPPGRQFLARP